MYLHVDINFRSEDQPCDTILNMMIIFHFLLGSFNPISNVEVGGSKFSENESRNVCLLPMLC